MHEIIWLACVNMSSMAILFNRHNISAFQASPIFCHATQFFYFFSRKSIFLLSTFLTTLARQGQSCVARPGQKSDVPLSARSWETDFSVGARLWNGAGGWNTVTPSSRNQLSMTGEVEGKKYSEYLPVGEQPGWLHCWSAHSMKHNGVPTVRAQLVMQAKLLLSPEDLCIHSQKHCKIIVLSPQHFWKGKKKFSGERKSFTSERKVFCGERKVSLSKCKSCLGECNIFARKRKVSWGGMKFFFFHFIFVPIPWLNMYDNKIHYEENGIAPKVYTVFQILLGA